ncbi:cache domain-containing protein [Microtetraspora glauca]|uniref:Cache domain-containing protein n=1 Tax=Microtetraspora glauca TaxID=1996 RepID=A0ABV3GTF2_MICGL
MTPESLSPPSGPENGGAERVAERIRALLGGVFDALDELGAEVVRRRRALLDEGRRLKEAHLGMLEPFIKEELARQPMADGLGFLAAPDVIGGVERYIHWWHRTGDTVARMRLNFDPTSVDLYDYLQMDWFVAARDRGERAVFGPYVDYTGANRYVLTLTVPVSDEIFLGVAGADLAMSDVEPALLRALRSAGRDALLVSAERRVVAANTPRWVVGSRLPSMPRPHEGEFVEVCPVGLDSGWVVALAENE